MRVKRHYVIGSLARCGCAWIVDQELGLDVQVAFCPDHVWYGQLELPFEEP